MEGNYSRFLEKKEEFLQAQSRCQEALANTVRREVEWLRRRPKARTTKAKARIDEAGRMMAELADVERAQRRAAPRRSISPPPTAAPSGSSRPKASPRSWAAARCSAISASCSAPGTRLGLLGLNGTGKTTLLRILNGEMEPDAGHGASAPTRCASSTSTRAANSSTSRRRCARAWAPAAISSSSATAPSTWPAGPSASCSARSSSTGPWPASPAASRPAC